MRQGGSTCERATPEPLDVEAGFRARSNQYFADVTVRVIDDAWRITELDVLSEERIQAPPGAAAVPGGL